MMRLVVAMLAWALAGSAGAEVYRWVDASGRVHYSNTVPPADARPSLVGADARGGFASTASLPVESIDDRSAAPPVAGAAPAPRGLEFSKYLALRHGMTEGELLGIAGEPDLRRRRRAIDVYTYMPTTADPFTTTVTLVRGRINEIDRARRF